MRCRAAVAVTVTLAVVSAGCSSDSDDADRTLPEVTLFTTTTTSTTTTTIEQTDTENETDGDEPSPDGSTADSTTTVVVPATTAATTSSTTPPLPSTSVPDPAAEFELTPDGIGAAAFGADPEGIIGFMSSFIGAPTADTGYVDPFEFGVCSGTQARRVYWGSLMLEFGDASNVTEGRLHFYAYEYGTERADGLEEGTPEGLRTPEGITLGSTVSDVAAAYPAATFLEGDDFIAPSVVVNDNFRGLLTGLSAADTVTVLTGGLPCQG